MSSILLASAAVFLVLILLGLAARQSRAGGGALAALPPDARVRLVQRVLAERRLATEVRSFAPDAADLVATGPSGTPAYVRVVSPPGGSVDAQEVQGTIATARSDYGGRCILVATGRVDPDARALAEEGGVELIDGRVLAQLARGLAAPAGPGGATRATSP